MSGLLAIGVVVIWFLIVLAIASRMGSGFSGPWRWLFRTAVFCGLLVLPVADEIVGWFQFKKLCTLATLQIEPEKVRGKTLKQVATQSFVVGAIDVERWDNKFVDPENGQVLASYTWVRAQGGWLSRFVGGSNPITFMDSYECKPKLEKRIEETYQFTLINN